MSVITKTNSSGRDTPQSGCFKTLKVNKTLYSVVMIYYFLVEILCLDQRKKNVRFYGFYSSSERIGSK